MDTAAEVPRTWSWPLPSTVESKMGGATRIRPRSPISFHGVALSHSHELYFHFDSFPKAPISVGKCRFKFRYLDLKMCLRKSSAEVFSKTPWKRSLHSKSSFSPSFVRDVTLCSDSISFIPPHFLWNSKKLLHTQWEKKANWPNVTSDQGKWSESADNCGAIETRANHLRWIKLTCSIAGGL